jgi:arylsulfatase A-like enzyme
MKHTLTLFITGLLLAALTVLHAAEAPKRSSKPNIVLILADDLGYGELGCYGGKVATPHLDRLAQEGQRWTQFYANSCVCSPTRAALLTGRYPQRADVNTALVQPIQDNEGLAPEEWTLAEALREAGYRTGLFGKWHLGSSAARHPLRQGFDEFTGCLSGMIDHTSHADKKGETDWWQGEERLMEPGYVTHLIERHAVDFIDRQKEQPFFLYLAFTTPHSPYTAPGASPVWKLGVENGGDHAKEPDALEGRTALVRAMDDAVGKVMDAVSRKGVGKETLVIFLSDNGAPGVFGNNPVFIGDNGGLRGQKFDLYEGGIRVPAIFHWLGRIAPCVVADPAITMDIMPTLLKLAGSAVTPPRAFDGVDLFPALMQGQRLPQRDLFWSFKNLCAIRAEDAKLVRTDALGKNPEAKSKTELFDLSKDRAESLDLSAGSTAQVEDFARRLDRWQKDVESGPKTEAKRTLAR